METVVSQCVLMGPSLAHCHTAACSRHSRGFPTQFSHHVAALPTIRQLVVKPLCLCVTENLCVCEHVHIPVHVTMCVCEHLHAYVCLCVCVCMREKER